VPWRNRLAEQAHSYRRPIPPPIFYGEQLTAKFGVPAIVENKPGAGAIIAIETPSTPPDGYTLLMTTSARFGRTALYSKLPYDLDKHRARGFFSRQPWCGVPEKIGVK
jgi:hypothetical protein